MLPRLRYRADLRPLATHVVYFAALALAWSLPAPWCWGTFPVLALTALQGAVQTHNAIHVPIFDRRWANRVYQVVLTLIYGHPVSAFVPGHTLGHHHHPESARDPIRTSKARFHPPILNLFLFFPRVVPDIVRTERRYASAMARRHPRWFGQLTLEAVALGAVTVALFVLDPWRALWAWVAPHLVAQWGIVTINLLQHDGCDPTSPVNHSRNFTGPMLNWLLFGNGYHTVHHDDPTLHWSLAAAAHRERVAASIHPALEQPSLPAYVWRTWVLGDRRRYDGAREVAAAPGPDEVWIPPPSDTAAHLGAMGQPR